MTKALLAPLVAGAWTSLSEYSRPTRKPAKLFSKSALAFASSLGSNSLLIHRFELLRNFVQRRGGFGGWTGMAWE
jgi:hypothetical protein